MGQIQAEVTGNMWRILVAVGDQVEDGDDLAIIESMKMEIPVEAEAAGTVTEILIAEGDAVAEGDGLFVVSTT